MAVFALPYTCETSSALEELQLELNALPEDDVLEQNFKKMNLIDFYKSLPVAECYNLMQFAKKFVCTFGSTYISEQLLSKVKHVKSKLRSNLIERHLLDRLRACTSTIEPNIDRLVETVQH